MTRHALRGSLIRRSARSRPPVRSRNRRGIAADAGATALKMPTAPVGTLPVMRPSAGEEAARLARERHRAARDDFFSFSGYGCVGVVIVADEPDDVRAGRRVRCVIADEDA